MGETDISVLLEKVQFQIAIRFEMTADADMMFRTEVNKYHVNFGRRFWDTLYKNREYSEGFTLRRGNKKTKC